MTKKTKLELTWPGKDQRPRLEPRILMEDPAKSFRAEVPASDTILIGQAEEGAVPVCTFDNMLIKGDNLLALKALEATHAGRVKCVFIDPPYNTGSAFEHYDDGIEHSLWLSLMRDRLELIHRLLSPDGSLWVTLDDNEAHYFKVMCDEVFGRWNFVATIIWEKRKSRENRRAFSFKHDHLLVYAPDKAAFEKRKNALPLNNDVLNRYRNPDNDSRGPWQSVAITAQAGHGTAAQFYQIKTPSGRLINPPAGNCWRYSEARLEQLKAENRIYFGASGNNVPRQKKFLSESEDAGLTPETIWYADDVATNDLAKRHSNDLFEGSGFANPKPEELLSRILTIATNPGDLVLDSFAGSGTTGAVAQKMGRRWIMVEIGDHADTHIVPRLRKVIDGSDQGGISKAVGWQGGGGFRYYTLAPSLLARDPYGNLVISKEYDGPMLARAMCGHLGFTYCPSADENDWWQHGRSSESDFLYVTTQSLTHDALKLLSEAVGEGRTLMVCARAFSGGTDGFANLTCRKIPATILTKCEWGRDNYSLNVTDAPTPAEEDGAPETSHA